jgi:hypothetical protein
MKKKSLLKILSIVGVLSLSSCTYKYLGNVSSEALIYNVTGNRVDSVQVYRSYENGKKYGWDSVETVKDLNTLENYGVNKETGEYVSGKNNFYQ